MEVQSFWVVTGSRGSAVGIADNLRVGGPGVRIPEGK